MGDSKILVAGSSKSKCASNWKEHFNIERRLRFAFGGIVVFVVVVVVNVASKHNNSFLIHLADHRFESNKKKLSLYHAAVVVVVTVVVVVVVVVEGGSVAFLFLYLDTSGFVTARLKVLSDDGRLMPAGFKIPKYH